MADENKGGGEELSKDILDEALKEFDAGGGFTGKPKGINTPPPKPATPPPPPKPTTPPPSQSGKPPLKKPVIDEEFPHFDDEDEEDAPPPQAKKVENNQPQGSKNNTTAVVPVKKAESTQKPSSNPKPNPANDFDDFDDEDDILDGDLIDEKNSSGGGGSGGGNKGGGTGGDGKDGDRKAMIIKKLKEPKNMIIIGIAFLFLLFLMFSGGGKKKKPKTQAVENAQVQQAVDSEINEAKKDEKIEKTPESATASQMPNISLAEIQLPNLDIKVPEVKPTNVDLVPAIPEPKPKPPEEPKIEEIKPPEVKEIVNINNVKTKEPKLDDLEEEDEISDVDIRPDVIKKKRNIVKDRDELKPIVTDFTGGTKITKDKKKGNTKDFIFVDADLDVEAEESSIKATKMQDPENVVAQGRMIDAVLETAINSTIGGQVRAIVTRDVYAEMGRNVLIPKGTRLYGEYGGASGKQAADRIVITWTRIMRPDNISANINSFASDQFGRSGIQGNVDNKYFSNMSTSILLSTIPLVTTIVTNAITNSRQNTVTTNAMGGTTVVQDPINIATQSFTKQISDATANIIKNMGDTQPTITLEQGTRVKVLVNQDIKLPVYKSVTKISSGVTS